MLGERRQVPVPRLRDHSVEDGITTITSDFVQGENLWDKWVELSQDQKLDIAKQLGEIMSSIRSLDPEPGSPGICGSGGGPVRDLRIYGSYTGGPFVDEAAFNDLAGC